MPRLHPGIVSSYLQAAHEPHIHVQAVIQADLGVPWIGYVRAAAPRAKPLKWYNVAGFVRDGTGHESRVVRDGLGEQTIVITDPMDMIRELDLTICETGRAPIAVCARALAGGRSALAIKLRRFMAENLLLQSGVGTVEFLVRAAISGGLWDHSYNALESCSTDQFIKRCKGSLRRATRLATQSTALIIGQRDRESARPEPEEWAEDPRSGLTAWHARHQLRQIGRANIIFDHDDSSVTSMVEEVRSAAEITAADWWLEGRRSEGSVRTGDDAQNVRLQMADIAAGWASSLIPTDGYLGVVMRFKRVLYNGERLVQDEAVRLDKLRVDHRRLIQSAAA